MAATRRRHAWRALLLGTASYLAVALLAPRMAAAEVATDGTLGRRVQPARRRHHDRRRPRPAARRQPVPQLPQVRRRDQGPGHLHRPGQRQERDRPGHRRRALLDRRHARLHHPRRRPLPAQPRRHPVRPERAAGREGLVPRQHGGRAAAGGRGGVQRAGHGRQHAERGRAAGVRVPGRGAGAITVDRGILAVPEGQALSLIGGDVTITSAPEGAGLLQAKSGRVTLTALGRPRSSRHCDRCCQRFSARGY